MPTVNQLDFVKRKLLYKILRHINPSVSSTYVFKPSVTKSWKLPVTCPRNQFNKLAIVKGKKLGKGYWRLRQFDLSIWWVLLRYQCHHQYAKIIIIHNFIHFKLEIFRWKSRQKEWPPKSFHQLKRKFLPDSNLNWNTVALPGLHYKVENSITIMFSPLQTNLNTTFHCNLYLNS